MHYFMPREAVREKEVIIALMASSASIEQCSLTGGRLRCLAMSVFLRDDASSMVLPCGLTVKTHEKGAI